MRWKSDPHATAASSPPIMSPNKSKLAKATPQPKNLSPSSSAFSSPSQLDDFDIMLFHEDFPHLLAIASKVKGIQKKIAKLSTTPCPSPSVVYRAKSALQPNDVLHAVERMQQALTATAPSPQKKTIQRGRYPITDSLMEDAMLLLQKQYDLELQRYNSPTPHPSPVAFANPNNKRGRTSPLTTAAPPITIKYAKWQTDILMQWMIDHKDSPFPDPDAIAALADQTGLSHSQIVNWTTNVRKRNRKATCENGKKPHHFLDFLFLVHDRESKEEEQAYTEVASQTAGLLPPLPPSNMRMMSTFPETKPHAQSLVAQPPQTVPSAPLLETNRYYQPATASGAPSRKVPPSLTLDTKPPAPVTSANPSYPQQHDPMPLSTKSNDTILVDFADAWLMAPEQKSPSHHHALLGARIQVPMVVEHGGNSSSHILPSVTADSHDRPMARNDSFSLGSLEDDEDILMHWSGTDAFM